MPSRGVLTRRAGATATRRVGQLALPVAVVAKELGVWGYGQGCRAAPRHTALSSTQPSGLHAPLGMDKTSSISATRDHHTIYARGLVDLDARILIDPIEGNGAVELRR